MPLPFLSILNGGPMGCIEYRSFSWDDIDALVKMWRASRSGWPPGFFGPSETTAATVAHEEKSSGALFTMLAFLGDEAVGYCRTRRYGGEPEASYVSMINVVPALQGRGIGKTLLLDAVKRSAEIGLYRIDLHTWPANMKAVPLYKKTGFFWVPDTKVYMQNYIPGLLGMRQFQDFLGGEDWYDCFSRDTVVEPDVIFERGRQVFSYIFHRGGESFEARFDKNGRCLCSLDCRGFSAGLSLEIPECFTGKPVRVTLASPGAPLKISCSDALGCGEFEDGGFTVTPLPVRIPPSSFEKSERVTVELKDLRLGIGIHAREEVCLFDSTVRFIPAGAASVSLDVCRNGSLSTIPVTWSVDGSVATTEVFPLSDCVYQSIRVWLPHLDPGIHLLSMTLGEGYPETVVLIAGASSEKASVDCRHYAMAVAGDRILAVRRKSGAARLQTRGAGEKPREIGGLFLCAGPPSWQSDLPMQEYDLAVSGDTVSGTTPWPSRPGLEYGFRVRLDPVGYAQCIAWVKNDSPASQKVFFRAYNGFFTDGLPTMMLFPAPSGLLRVRPVENQLPDWDEDLSDRVEGMAAPWYGNESGGFSAMFHYPGWLEMEYHMPGTPETEIPPGGKLESPAFRMLFTGGGSAELLRLAEALGWNVGDLQSKALFPEHNLKPLMGSGADVFLSHPLHGERDAEIRSGGKRVYRGKVKRDATITGTLRGRGAADVSVIMSGRETVVPVHLVGSRSTVVAGEKNGLLSLKNSRLKALLDPCACGQVFSATLDGTEFLRSSRPASQFAWEKPWFGGIHPVIFGINRPFPLELETPRIDRFQFFRGGLTWQGWRMTWRIDHRDFGSVDLEWVVMMPPGAPVIHTSATCRRLGGTAGPGGLHLRGFLQPGGSVEDEILTCEGFPGLRQGRKHAGAWVPVGKWGRVQREGFFVEAQEPGELLTGDDYGALGCHFSVYSDRNMERSLDVDWIFGNSTEDDSLALIHRAHL
jgi:ribosomal protein S18 acetylase RimI-like enzyme